jgi:hypothetical protein
LFEAGLTAAELSLTLAGRSAGIPTGGGRLNGSPVEKRLEIIGAGERDRAIEVIRRWFAEYVDDYLLIQDPYFGPEELWIMKLLLEEKPGCRVSVVTGMKHQNQLHLPRPWQDAYKDHWEQVSDQSPPSTRILVVGEVLSGAPPFHDRYMVTAGSGLRLGTSLRSIGLEKDSETSRLSAEEAHHIESEQLRDYLDLSRHEHVGKRLACQLFDLI